MGLTLKDVFNKKYNKILTNNTVQQLISFVKSYELRDDHPLILNSPYIGFYRLIFSPSDRNAIFEIFNIDEEELEQLLEHVSSYNKNFETISDVFNIFMIWLIHLAMNNSSLSKKMLYEFSINVLMLLHYKFFSSRLFRVFKYQVDEDVMRYTIESLNYRYDIVKYGSWKKLFRIKSEQLLDASKSIHYKTFKEFKPDDKVYYIISDIKTKVNALISSIADVYYENFNTNKSIESYNATNVIDGEKILKDSKYIYDTILYYLLNQMMNEKTFINEQYIKSLINIQTSLSYPLFYRFLVYMCNLTKDQKKSNTLDEIVKSNDEEFYLGMKTLLYELISFIFKELISRKININNKLAIFAETKKIFSSSRYTDKSFLNVRSSIKKHILNSKLTNREVTINGLITSFVLYIMLKTFEVLK